MEQVSRFEDEFGPIFADRFATEFLVRQVVGLVVRTGEFRGHFTYINQKRVKGISASPQFRPAI